MNNELTNIPEMFSDFERIRKISESGEEYWSSRDLCIVMGYSAYWRFENVIAKALSAATKKGMSVKDHFNLTVEMVKLGSGACRKVKTFHLSHVACLLIAENADKKKPATQLAQDYFRNPALTRKNVDNSLKSNILIYKTNQGETKIQVIFNSETFWMSQRRMAELFGVDVRTVNYHLVQIYDSGELTQESTIRKIGIVQKEGEREVERNPLFYNLDAIIAVGYRVNSYQATQFRIWATSVLKDFIVKGFVLDDERLKQGSHFGRDYFDDLLQRIREIRTSERRYYQKITDIYAECSSDYDPKAETTQLFFKMVQNMMHWAVTHQTAAEIVFQRADAEQPHMGLTTWKNAPDGRVQKSDVIIAKNYLSDKELSQLSLLSTAFIDLAEMKAQNHTVMTMDDWKKQLVKYLEMNDLDVLKNTGNVSTEEAQNKAYHEYEKFRIIQDKEFLSDFDKEMKCWKERGLFDDIKQ